MKRMFIHVEKDNSEAKNVASDPGDNGRLGLIPAASDCKVDALFDVNKPWRIGRFTLTLLFKCKNVERLKIPGKLMCCHTHQHSL